MQTGAELPFQRLIHTTRPLHTVHPDEPLTYKLDMVVRLAARGSSSMSVVAGTFIKYDKVERRELSP